MQALAGKGVYVCVLKGLGQEQTDERRSKNTQLGVQAWWLTRIAGRPTCTRRGRGRRDHAAGTARRRGCVRRRAWEGGGGVWHGAPYLLLHKQGPPESCGDARSCSAGQCEQG